MKCESILEFYNILDNMKDFTECEFEMWDGIFRNLNFIKNCIFLEKVRKEKLRIYIDKTKNDYIISYAGSDFYKETIIQKNKQGEWIEISE